MKYRVEVNKDRTFWYKFGTKKLHREDGPAVEYSDGYKEWYKEGKLHRLDGPAVEYSNGTKFWYKEGKLHREDDPAVEWFNGTKSYYINGIQLTEEDFNNRKTPSKMKKLVDL